MTSQHIGRFRVPTAVLALALGALLAAPARAQIDGPSFEAGFAMGRPWMASGYDMKDRALYSWRLGWSPQPVWGLEATLDYVNSYGVLARTYSTDFLQIGVRGVAQLQPVERISPYVAAGPVLVSVLRAPNETEGEWDRSPGMSLAAGVRAHLTRNVVARFENRFYLASFEEDEAISFAMDLGVSVRFGRDADADGDGVSNSRDQCPQTPPGADVDLRGCPFDDDFDGVPRGIDECPDTPPNTPVDEKGCPLKRGAGPLRKRR